MVRLVLATAAAAADMAYFNCSVCTCKLIFPFLRWSTNGNSMRPFMAKSTSPAGTWTRGQEPPWCGNRSGVGACAVRRCSPSARPSRSRRMPCAPSAAGRAPQPRYTGRCKRAAVKFTKFFDTKVGVHRMPCAPWAAGESTRTLGVLDVDK